MIILNKTKQNKTSNNPISIIYFYTLVSFIDAKKAGAFKIPKSDRFPKPVGAN